MGLRTGHLAAIILCSTLACGMPASDNANGAASSLPEHAGTTHPGVDCSASALDRAQSFLEAYSLGQHSLAADHFVVGAAFEWYSDSDLRYGESAATDRSTLEEFFRKQYLAGDELQLRSIDHVEYEAERGIAHFSGVLLRNGALYPFKGALDCMTLNFVVWSIGEPQKPSGANSHSGRGNLGEPGIGG